MKRAGYLMERIAEPSNLREAFFAAARRKSSRPDVQLYREELAERLDELRWTLLNGAVEVGGYQQFVIHDPKERVITVAPFGQRVLHHAVMRVCEPFFENRLIPRSYACRRGKGRVVALDEAQKQCAKYEWYLKLDIRRYFDSVPHEGLLNRLRGVFKDRDLLLIFEKVIRSFEASPGCGLPIGNLTSQHFANLYLDAVDRFIEGARPRGGGRFVVLRYMDDLVVFAPAREDLVRLRLELRGEIVPSLGLRLKQERIGPTSSGVPFLGCVVRSGFRELSRRSRLRFRRRVMCLDRVVAEGRVSEEDAQRRGTALVAFAKTASSEAFRRWSLREHFWAAAMGDTGPRIGGFGVAVGTTTRTTRRCRIATTTTTPTTATTTTVSVSPSAQDESSSEDLCPEPAAVQRRREAGESGEV